MCEQSPLHLRTDQTAAFAAETLGDRPHVLELGSHDTHLAGKLAGLGFAVTMHAPDGAELESGHNLVIAKGALSLHAPESFDAIVLTNVLSTDPALDATLLELRRLLKPEGRLIVDELDIDAPDHETLVWFYDTRDTLVSLVERERGDVARRWRSEHRHVRHSGEALEAAIAAHFSVRDVRRAEHLYHRIAAHVTTMRDGAERTQAIRVAERALIAAGAIKPVGIQIVADRPQVVACNATLRHGVRCALAPDHDGLHFYRNADGRTFEWG